MPSTNFRTHPYYLAGRDLLSVSWYGRDLRLDGEAPHQEMRLEGRRGEAVAQAALLFRPGRVQVPLDLLLYLYYSRPRVE